MKKYLSGFTIVELLVVISIISLLAGIAVVNFGDARAESRDKVRQNTLLEMQVALKLYEQQYGRYPEAGCGGDTDWTGPGLQGSLGVECDEYIVGLAPDFISALPVDPLQKNGVDHGYAYKVDIDGNAYKLMSYQTAEVDLVESYNHNFARCQSSGGPYCGADPEDTTYAVYSFGAEDW
jgi:prepilin-type N-terminal cleavage/methylation domain-containing protein